MGIIHLKRKKRFTYKRTNLNNANQILGEINKKAIAGIRAWYANKNLLDLN